MNKLISFIKILIITICLSIGHNNNLLATENINEYILEEITDNTANPYFSIPIRFGHTEFDFLITKHLILVTIAGILSIISMKYLAHKLKRPFKRPTYIQNFLEVIINYMNKNIFSPTLGEEGKKYIPFCLTLFLFILFANILGIIPPLIKLPTENKHHFAYLAGGIGANIGFTGAISFIVLITYIAAGIKKKGFFKYWASLVPPHLPIVLVPIIWFLEFITVFNRAFALTIRLFANIAGGHIMMIVIPYLIILFGTLLISPIAIGFLSFIYILEIFVAVLQAYIFSLLSAVYISIAISDEH